MRAIGNSEMREMQISAMVLVNGKLTSVGRRHLILGYSDE